MIPGARFGAGIAQVLWEDEGSAVTKLHGKCQKVLLPLPQSFLKNADIAYWIGLQKNKYPWYEYDWLEEGEPDGEGLTDAWFWVDGSLYERYPMPTSPLLWRGLKKHFTSLQ